MKTTLFTISFALIVLCFSGCSDDPHNLFQGYVEGEYVYVASPIGGKLDILDVTRGQQVTSGTPLFTLEHAYEQAVVEAARHGLQRTEDNLSNLSKGQRPTELASIQARIKQARTSAALAKIEYERRVKLIAEHTISQEELDRTKSDHDQKNQFVRELLAELATARLGARSDEISAATAEILQAQALLDQALWNLNQKVQNSPTTSLVFDTLYRVGEWVAPGQPVVSLLPPQNIEIRFFVPENIVGVLHRGQKALVSFDGAEKLISTEISYISPSAEYTPPIIYSSTSRAKLVFMIKSKPIMDDAPLLHPGQPVDVVIPDLAS